MCVEKNELHKKKLYYLWNFIYVRLPAPTGKEQNLWLNRQRNDCLCGLSSATTLTTCLLEIRF